MDASVANVDIIISTQLKTDDLGLNNNIFGSQYFNKKLNKAVKGNLPKLSPADQTSGLESFHRAVCHFALKLVHYFHPKKQGNSK
ncbi:hypothetical protein KUTeg_014878 [Tegillarca granosa]|uniref:Uncharacterized protein n=1 Tax=Tegillarca granosa TaxID=220873 RepID=A0ABQ9EP92_TEGGR|nr:hypothetical protein KUTeg_014878 [Tegillarca granosa]